MPAFAQRQHAKLPPKPPGVVVLKPEHWHAEWASIPTADVAVGVRPLSELEVQQVMAEAAKTARLYHPEADSDDPVLSKALDEALISCAVARAATNPNDARDPYFTAADEMVPLAWLPATIRRFWDELNRVTIASSPIVDPASDETLSELAGLIERGNVTKLLPSRELRLRKLLAFCIDELKAAEATA